MICFIKGRMSTGYAIGMDILNNSIKKLLKLRNIKIIQRRKSSIIIEMVDGNTCCNVI